MSKGIEYRIRRNKAGEYCIMKMHDGFFDEFVQHPSANELDGKKSIFPTQAHARQVLDRITSPFQIKVPMGVPI